MIMLVSEQVDLLSNTMKTSKEVHIEFKELDSANETTHNFLKRNIVATIKKLRETNFKG